MNESITVEIFRHLVDLAALELDEAEAEYLRSQLNNQLKAVHELASIEAPDETPITSHGVPYTAESSPALRSDEVHPSEVEDDILAQAPETQGRYIVVPDIPHTDLP